MHKRPPSGRFVVKGCDRTADTRTIGRPRLSHLLLLAVLVPHGTAAADYGSAVRATPGLVAHWPLDDPPGSASAADVVGGRAATLRLTDHRSESRLGVPPGIDTGGTALWMTGVASAVVGNDAALDLPGDLTVEAWVAPAEHWGDRYAVSRGSAADGYHLLVEGGAPTLQVGGARVTAPVLPATGWHHVVGTLAGSTLSIYVDGRPAGTAATTGPHTAGGHALWLGRRSFGDWGFLMGGLDEVALYDRALTADEVAAHFDAGVVTAAPSIAFSAGPPAVTNQTRASLAVTGSKGGLTFRCKTDTLSSHACPGAVELGDMYPGLHTVTVTAADRWGAVATAQFTWTVDQRPPDTVALVHLATAGDPGSVVLGSEPGATFECRVPGRWWQPCPAAFAMPPLTAPTVLSFRAVDGAGNADRTPAEVAVWPPDPREPGTFLGGRAAFVVEGDLHLNPLTCSLDGNRALPCPSPLRFERLGYGQHTLRIRAAALIFPAMAWQHPTPAPRIVTGHFPALVRLGSRRQQARLAPVRRPRILFQSNSSGEARVALVRGAAVERAWTSPVQHGSNVVRMPAAAWEGLEPGRHVLVVVVTNAVGTADPVALRFDAVRATRR